MGIGRIFHRAKCFPGASANACAPLRRLVFASPSPQHMLNRKSFAAGAGASTFRTMKTARMATSAAMARRACACMRVGFQGPICDVISTDVTAGLLHCPAHGHACRPQARPQNKGPWPSSAVSRQALQPVEACRITTLLWVSPRFKAPPPPTMVGQVCAASKGAHKDDAGDHAGAHACARRVRAHGEALALGRSRADEAWQHFPLSARGCAGCVCVSVHLSACCSRSLAPCHA